MSGLSKKKSGKLESPDRSINAIMSLVYLYLEGGYLELPARCHNWNVYPRANRICSISVLEL